MVTPYRRLGTRFINWLKQSLSVLWLLILAAYLGVVAGQAMYHNYQDQQQTIELKKQLLAAQAEKQHLQGLLVYYQTQSYQDKVLRSAFMLRQPNEQVYALPESDNAVSEDQDVIPATAASSTKSSSVNEPIWQQWNDYLLHKE